MLFMITTWIIILTVLGIVAVCAFRLCCEDIPEDARKDRYNEKLKHQQQQSHETNHYEPLNHQLKQIEADGNQDSGISVTETTLSESKKANEIGVPEEKKPLNTQAAPEPEALTEVTVSDQTGSAEVKRSVEKNSPAVLEVRNSEQSSLLAATGNAVVSSGNSEIVSLPPVAKVINATTAVTPAVAIVVSDQNDLHKSRQDLPPALPIAAPPSPTTDGIAADQQPYNNEIPMPYVEVESATLPRLSTSNEAVAKIGTPSA